MNDPFLIGGIFVYSGWSKLSRPSEFFQLAINLYDVVPKGLVPGVAATLPWFELAGVSHGIGAGVQRWLFFAQAEHVVGLYYGKR